MNVALEVCRSVSLILDTTVRKCTIGFVIVDTDGQTLPAKAYLQQEY